MLHRIASSAASKVVSARAMSSATGIGVAGPPQRRIPFATKVGLGLVMCTGACAYPAWVLTHINDYKGNTE